MLPFLDSTRSVLITRLAHSLRAAAETRSSSSFCFSSLRTMSPPYWGSRSRTGSAVLGNAPLHQPPVSVFPDRQHIFSVLRQRLDGATGNRTLWDKERNHNMELPGSIPRRLPAPGVKPGTEERYFPPHIHTDPPVCPGCQNSIKCNALWLLQESNLAGFQDWGGRKDPEPPQPFARLSGPPIYLSKNRRETPLSLLGSPESNQVCFCL